MQVYNCLQPLMLCMSHSGTLKIVDRLCEDYDMDVYTWNDEQKQSLQVESIYINSYSMLNNYVLYPQ